MKVDAIPKKLHIKASAPVHPSETHPSPDRAGTPNRGALAGQTADFFQQEICVAICLGELSRVIRVITKSPEVILLRGSMGETILHVAILFKQAKIAEWIVQHHGESMLSIQFEEGIVKKIRLIDVAYGEGLQPDLKPYAARFLGETALHQACKNGLTDLVAMLVEKRVNMDAQATGFEFETYKIDWKYPNLYSGSTPLHFVGTQANSLEIVQLLVEKGNANIYITDAYGNNVLHVMAYYGMYNETFKYLEKRNQSGSRQTPAQLGIHYGHAALVESLKEPLWTFGNEICQYQVPLDDICPIIHSKKVGPNSNSFKPILTDIVARWDHNMIVHPIFKSIIRVKWDVYVRRYFLSKLIWSLATVLSFTLSIALDSGTATASTTMVDAQYGLVVVAFVLSLWGYYDIIEEYVALYRKTHFLPRHLRRLKPPFWESLESRISYIWNLVRRDLDEDLICLCFCICVTVSFGLSTAARFNSSMELKTLAHVHGIGAIFGWIHILYYARGMRTIGPLILVLRQMIAKGFMRWILIYLAVLVGFSTAFYAQMKNTDYTALGLGSVPADWNSYGGSFLWTLRFLFSMDDFVIQRQVGGDFTMYLFLMHQFVVIIVLLNVLIALLVDVFTAISTHYDSSWLLQMARITVNIDRDLTRHDNSVIGTHFGFHHNPVEVKGRRIRTKGLPGGALSRAGSSLSANFSASTGINATEGERGTSSVVSKHGGMAVTLGNCPGIAEATESLPSIMGSIHSLAAVKNATSTFGIDVGETVASIADSRHFFLFLDRTTQSEEGKSEATTVRLITGVFKTPLGVEDVEFVMDEKYWSFKKILWDLRHVYFKQSDDIWANIGKGL
ncbi:hypothetical protein BDR26DRAFT_1004360 [Obelidium mucronatum]|nr:hypothetical protein BDR26DRAFT_1004360 [Obelidium mucronatum]